MQDGAGSPSLTLPLANQQGKFPFSLSRYQMQSPTMCNTGQTTVLNMELGLKVEQNIEWNTIFNRNYESSPFAFHDATAFLKLSIIDRRGILSIVFEKEIPRSFQALTLLVIGAQPIFHPPVSYENISSSCYHIWESRKEEILKCFEKSDILCFKVKFNDVRHSPDLATTESRSIRANFSLIQTELHYLSQDFSDLFENAVHPDVQIKCSEGVIHAHRAILSARSKVFETMFKSSTEESNSGEVHTPDVDTESMRLFLKYVYSGKIPDVPFEIVPRLYSLAASYGVLSLRDYFSDFMVRNLSDRNYISFLVLTEDSKDDDLKDAIIDYITDDVRLMKNQDWLQYSETHKDVAFEVYQKYVEKSCR